MFTLGYGDLLNTSAPLSKRGGVAHCCQCSVTSTSLQIVKTLPENWTTFSRRVSGEWSGIGVDFDGVGKPVELPSQIVPHKFRRWGLKLFDWETYCATIASEEQDSLVFRSKTFCLCPSLHHQALKVSIHNTEERKVTGRGKCGGALAFHPSGAYVAVWQNSKVVEHCLVDENKRRVRGRILHRFKQFGEIVITVFKEKWEDEYQEGRTVEKFLTQHPGLCSSSRLRGDELSGAWEVTRSSVAPAGVSASSIYELVEETSNSDMRRDVQSFVPLPRGFWSAVKNVGTDEIDVEGGWLISPGVAVASRCRITSSGQILKVELETQTRTG